MDIGLLLGFAAITSTLIAVPGPDWAYVLSASLRDRVVAPAVGGLALGYVLITAVVAVGVGPLLAEAPVVLLALTVGGAGYLVVLGARTLRSTTGPAGPEGQVMATGPLGYISRGMAVSGLNPKAMLLFLSILPQFTNPAQSWSLPAQLAALGLVHVVISGVFYLALGSAAGRVLGSRPGAAQATTRLAGIAMIALGIGLLGERLLEAVRAGGVVV
ncbi:LysE family translocator [Kytococcus schroeteri]|uniref:LysE family translocator n=1 Tax=Kytococcus schroeteri TaxID=138300 RepID=A0A2I1PC35_9MICO|nr:LysE family translocator [Kytococcus schroeteri]PKZ42193.1 LysE family translocator [Kytococcus schroeteri]